MCAELLSDLLLVILLQGGSAVPSCFLTCKGDVFFMN